MAWQHEKMKTEGCVYVVTVVTIALLKLALLCEILVSAAAVANWHSLSHS